MDDELFRLCRSVYKATGWTGTNQVIGIYYQISEVDVKYGIFDRSEKRKEPVDTPLYTSDYLLEKLQEVGFNDGPSQGLVLEYVHKGHGIWGWRCHFPGYYYKYGNDEWIGFDPIVLKALLKLCLALHKEGVL